jgi:predicted metal-dependent phosphoesterase TrpH
LGKAVLHIHSTFSDGLASVNEILEELEYNSDIDVVGFTDHDDVRAYAHALEWKRRHPQSRVQPLWGIELTCWRFKHLLAYIFSPPFPRRPFQRFQTLPRAVRTIKHAGGYVIVPHVDAFWIGLGRDRVAREAAGLGIDGVELLTPVLKSDRSVRRVSELSDGGDLLAIGGSDAHHLEDLYRVVMEFPGRTVQDLGRAFAHRTVTPRWGYASRGVPLGRQLRQHTRALVVVPALHVGTWARERMDAVSSRAAQVAGSGGPDVQAGCPPTRRPNSERRL